MLGRCKAAAAAVVACGVGWGAAAGAQGPDALEFAPSNCGVAAVADARLWRAQLPPIGLADLTDGAVAITYAHHATFLIETPSGVAVATDFADYAPVDAPPAQSFVGHDGRAVTPDLVTMNGAHDSHNTGRPHPEIGEMLLGWAPIEGARVHEAIVGPVRVRNVTTDVYRGVGPALSDANSIFVFEIDGLCIGHLGHLHRPLTPEQLSAVGQLDVVLMPVDGVDLMRPEDLRAEANRLGARVVIPMHAFTAVALAAFIDTFARDYDVVFADGASVILSEASFPSRPTLLVLREAAYR